MRPADGAGWLDRAWFFFVRSGVSRAFAPAPQALFGVSLSVPAPHRRSAAASTALCGGTKIRPHSRSRTKAGPDHKIGNEAPTSTLTGRVG
jgi:hypothetical protein